MFNDIAETTAFLKSVMERATMYVLALLAAIVSLYTIACAFGLTPWLNMVVQTGPDTQVQVGVGAQIIGTFLLIGLCSFLPSNARVARLEYSHRRFEMNMQDVARAYYVAHAEDRKGAFKMQSEFDSVRERLALMREHPDLDQIEPQILELAAQMSHVSRDLADTYSDEKMDRALSFLRQREEELEQFNARIDRAKSIVGEMTRWKDRLDLDETMARSQLFALRDAFADALPELDDLDAPAPQAIEDTQTTPLPNGVKVAYPYAAAAE